MFWLKKNSAFKNLYLKLNPNLTRIYWIHTTFLIVLILFIEVETVYASQNNDNEIFNNATQILRFKRQGVYEDPYYNNYYGW